MASDKKQDIFINRELSWLEFNRRVLDLSSEKQVPLGERLGFASIYSSNLDEFFMIRVGSLYDQTLLKSDKKENKTGMTPKQQLTAIMPAVLNLQAQCDKSVSKLYTALGKQELFKVDFDALTTEEDQFWKKYFLHELYPVLSPQIVDKRHPFPFLRNQDIYIGALLKDNKSEKTMFGLVPVSSQFDRVLFVPGQEGTQFALVEELLLHFIELIFGKLAPQEACVFRVTRNADINVEEGMFDHDIDYRVVMGELLKKRRKLAAVRVQVYGENSAAVQAFLQEKLLLPAEQCVVQKTPVELSFLRKLGARLRAQNVPDLFYPEVKPVLPEEDFSLYTEVQKRDELLCFPYQNIRPFIQMLNEAAVDPEVVSIKMTLYRVASESKIIEALINAAEHNKEVVTIVELRARFDEQNNINWSRALENAGCTVIYGFTDYKVHSKLTLITRKTDEGYSYISQIGTGNYNEKTSELYTDLSFVTANKKIGEEVAEVFTNLALEQLTENVEVLIAAPLRFKSVLLQEMENEIEYQKSGGNARITIKCNSISDREIIQILSDASVAGVQVHMIVRGICCLQAGLPGLTENVTVRSIVGRYLEHSRIYAFGEGERLRIYIASGDFLTRNTERRVEIGVRIDDPVLQQTLCDILDLQWQDTANAKEMQPDGSYKKIEHIKGDAPVDSQMLMYPYLQKRVPQTHLRCRVPDGQQTRQNLLEPEITAEPPKENGLLGKVRRAIGKIVKKEKK